ncbi:hypothetical protein GECvBN5_gp176 [Salmonella phage GEC_vB_N5]|uniref:Uncharacterized protein n=1 Tax=Salmonella phage GEC_vB_N5 TaxID=2777378 RepID=A0A7S9XCT4_9CAUD|nr:hypothetical protein GECvBN5_gp176 [Salmonella phage GEC_vB_N5]
MLWNTRFSVIEGYCFTTNCSSLAIILFVPMIY